MRFACTQENLVQGLNMVSHITGKNINLPVLGNVLIKTEGGGLKMSATNLEIAINCFVRGKVDEEGEYSVPAKLLLDYVSLLPSGKVELQLTEEGLEVRSNENSNEKETVFRGLPASEFPLLPKMTKSKGYSLPAADLKKALQQVCFSASVSESRPELCGVACFFKTEGDEKGAIFAATDSYRLSECRLTLGGDAQGETISIVPSRSMQEISRIISGYKDDIQGSQEVSLSFTDNQLVMSYGSVELVTRLLEGKFPPYQDIIPKTFNTQAVLPRDEFLKAVRAASLFSRQGLFDVHISFDAEKGRCTVASADQGTGKTQGQISGTVEGSSTMVTLNYRYVMDGVSAMTSANIRLCLVDGSSPVLILPEPADEGFRYLVMPIRQ
ncbi:MAG: DNA polymerase III subunit beta [Patescibacteria group bacterium]